jgi:cardiolipin synthase
MSNSHESGSVYPWRNNAGARLLVDPEHFVPEMLSAINAASSYILLEMYFVESAKLTSSFIDALLAAAERGVAIKIILDAFGSRNLHESDRQQLQHPQIELVFYHPLKLRKLLQIFIRDHRKLLLIDGQTGFTGGMGFGDGIVIEAALPLPWHDAVVRFEGLIVSDWQSLFARQWQRITSIRLNLPVAPLRPSTECQARLVCSEAVRPNPVYGHLRLQILAAKQRVWIATAYFLPSWRLRKAMHAASKRGVDVRLLLPGPITDNRLVRYASQRFYGRMLNAGIRIYEYQPTFMHAKVSLVDDWVSIGSANFDRWSISRNLEANLEVNNPGLATTVQNMFLNDFEQSLEITAADWQQRPAYQRWRERIFGLIENWLNKR